MPARRPIMPAPILTSWDAGRFVLGALLLVSASLKLHLLLTATAFVSNDWLASPRVQWLAVGWESALALWLFSGWRGNVSRWIALATFGIFAAVSLHEAAAGKRTCCCFGAVQAQPWFVFAMDLGIVALLYRTQPTTTTRPILAPFVRTATMTLAALCLVTGVTAASWYAPPMPTLQILDWPETPLVVEPGSRTEWKFRIYNPGSEPVEIGRIETSCECFEVSTLGNTVDCGSLAMMGCLDLSGHHKSFRGDLRLDGLVVVRNGSTIVPLTLQRWVRVQPAAIKVPN